jgi:carboxyl-terminal processing protease
MTRYRKKKNWILGMAVFILALSIGLLSFRNQDDFKLIKNIEIFSNLFRELNYFYVDDLDPEEMIQAGIEAMLETLDPYTVFIPESELENLRFMTTGQYGGIGSLIRKEGDYITITEIYKGFPADQAGLKAGDVILEIDGKSIAGKSSTEVSEQLKGLPNSTVEITIQRFGQDEPIKKSIGRKEISISNVPYYGMMDDQLGYIRLSHFTTDAGEEVRKALLDLKNGHHLNGLILDLRGNSGGLLNEAVRVCNVFVDRGFEIVSTRGRVEKNNHTYVTSNQPVDTLVPLAILVDRGSASAAEIVAGAIQDLDRGIIVGERTFGKGLVQITRSLGYNNQLKLTSAKYYIPSGRCIQALDYSNRNEDGSVGHIPDSLITEFKTLHGRSVFDGGGIEPDVKVNPEEAQALTVQLYTQDIIFDYATRYATRHDRIAPIEAFSVSNEDFEDFIAFTRSSGFDHESRSEHILDQLIETSKREALFEKNQLHFEALKENLQFDLDQLLHAHREEISKFLNTEIIGRYYYQAGKIQSTLRWDQDVIEASGLLLNPEIYSGILKPASTEITASNF